jgi:hypothetical protein
VRALDQNHDVDARVVLQQLHVARKVTPYQLFPQVAVEDNGNKSQELGQGAGSDNCKPNLLQPAAYMLRVSVTDWEKLVPTIVLEKNRKP